MQLQSLFRSAGINAVRRHVIGLLFILVIVLLHQTAQAFWPFAPERQAPTGALIQTAVPSPEALEKARMGQAKGFQDLITGMAEELFRNLEDPDPEVGELADGVLVCTFVDLKKLYRTSSFGRYLAEQMMTEMQHRRYTVIELRKSNSIMVQEKKGEYGLSREPEEIRSEVAAGAMLTGTYTPAQDHVIVNAKIVDNRTAALLSSATVIFPRNSLVNQLLKDSSSAIRTQPEPIYMKRLEL